MVIFVGLAVGAHMLRVFGVSRGLRGRGGAGAPSQNANSRGGPYGTTVSA